MKLGVKIFCVTGGLLLVAVLKGGLAPSETTAMLPQLPPAKTNLFADGLNHVADIKKAFPAIQTTNSTAPATALIALSGGENDHRLLLNHLQLTK